MIHDRTEPQPATFWYPGQRKRFRGQYQILDDGGVEISVVGSLGAWRPSLALRPVADVLFADVGGSPVTCTSVYPVHSQGHGVQQWSRYTIQAALENAHMRDPDAETFGAASAEYDSLQVFRRKWALDRDELDFGRVARTRREHDLSVEVGEFGTVTFGIDVLEASEALPERRIYESRHFARVAPHEPQTRDYIWRHLFMPLSALFTLTGLGGGQTKNVVLWPKRGARSRRDGGSLFGVRSRVHTARVEVEKRNYGSLIVHADNWDVSEHLQSWFSLWHRCPVAFSSFSSALDTNAVAPKLLFATSACEALHASLHPEVQRRNVRQQKRLDEVLGSIESRSHRNWANWKLKTAHYPPLATRLKALVGEIDPGLARDLLGPNVNAWAEHVVDARNAISHSDERAVTYHTNPPLVWELCTTLTSVFALVVMNRIGFTPESAAQAFRDSWTAGQLIGKYPATWLGQEE